MKKKLINNDVIEFLIGISLVMSVYGNIISYYLTGNKNDLVRTIISWGVIFGIVTILMGYVGIIIGAMLNLEGYLGIIFAIATMGAFILHTIDSK